MTAHRAIVYAYGCRTPIAGLEYAEAEFERATQLWDKLVEIDRTIESQLLQRAELDDSAIIRASEGIAQLTARFAEDPDDKLAREERRKLYAERRTLLKAWNKTHKEVLREYEERRQAATKLARQQSECYWGQYLRVLQAYETGRAVCRKMGRRLCPFDADRDDGVLAVQIQRTRSGLGAAPAELTDGTVSDLQVSAGGRERILEMRVDAEGHTVKVPLIWHRDLPTDCRVKGAQLTWRKRIGRVHWQLCLVLNVPVVPLRVSSAVAPAQVTFHWAREGGLKVLSVIPPEGGSPSIWALPPRWLGRADLIARRSSESNALLVQLREAVATNPSLADICGIDSIPQIMDQMQMRWHQLRVPVREVYRRLRHEWAAHEGLRGKVIRERRDYYRHIAREVTSRWDVIALPELDLSAVATAQRGKAGNSDRHLAALHTLRAEIIHQAAKSGCHVIASGPGITPPEKRGSSSWHRRKRLAADRSRSPSQAPEYAGV